MGRSTRTTSPSLHSRSSDTYPMSSGTAPTFLPLTSIATALSLRSTYAYNEPGTGRFRAQPGMRSLIVPLTGSAADTDSRDVPPHGMSLSIESASRCPPN